MTGLPDNFWTKVRESDCWIWYGAVNNKGYGCFAVGRKSVLAHRLAYEDARGPIPKGMTIDHVCRVRNCVNPNHLEVVTIAENNRRKKVAGGLAIGGSCHKGHYLADESSVYRHPRGHVECRQCRRKPHRQSKNAAPFIPEQRAV